MAAGHALDLQQHDIATVQFRQRRRCCGRGLLPLKLLRSEHLEVGHHGLAVGERSRLVEDDGPDGVRRLERCATLDEHAVLGADTRANHDGRRDGQAKGTRAGDHEHADTEEEAEHDGPTTGLVPGLGDTARRDAEAPGHRGQDCDEEHRGNELC